MELIPANTNYIFAFASTATFSVSSLLLASRLPMMLANVYCHGFLLSQVEQGKE